MAETSGLLTAQDEIRLAKLIEAGLFAGRARARGDHSLATGAELSRIEHEGRMAWEEFLLANVRLVQAVAAQQAGRTCVGTGELFQEGFVGLAEALRRWDWRAGFRFSTYATHWIRNKVAQAAAASASVPGSPGTALRARRVQALAESLHRELRREATDDELADLIGRSAAWVARMRTLQPCTSLDPELMAAEYDSGDDADVLALVQSLPQSEARVVGLRFGIDTPTPMRQREAAVALGISLSTLRRREARGLRRLRSWLRTEQAA